MKKTFKALSFTSAVHDWLEHTHQPRILHLFDRACNLLNERGEVLSVVLPEIGRGPFNLVVEADILFTKHISLESPICISPDHLAINHLNFSISDSKPWNPRPCWERLHSEKDRIVNQLAHLPITSDEPFLPNMLISGLSSALARADISIGKSIASQLAGLGLGLTPAGDDFIMGALYAVWIIYPPEIAGALAGEIAEVASALTTSLSAAWIRSAGRGEAGILWHTFFDALAGDEDIQLPITKLLAVGETSGADALAGFFGVLTAFNQRIISECPS